MTRTCNLIAAATILATAASADLAVIRDGRFTGTFYATDKPEYRAFHTRQGETCVWLAARPEIVSRVRNRPVYRTPSSNELARAENPDIDVQAAKSEALKVVENRFLSLCEQLTGSKTKASFGTLNTAIEGLMTNDAATATAVSLRLLAIDAEAKREGGLNWWDTCTWHEDVAE